MIAKYRKAAAQVALSILVFLVGVMTDGMSAVDWALTAGVAVNAANVAIVPQLDEGIGRVAKTVSTFLLAGLAVLVTVIAGGLTAGELTQVVITACAAIGLTAVPNNWPPAIQPSAGAAQAAPPRAGW